MKVYISGQITGIDYNEACKRFSNAENYINTCVGNAVNPMKIVPFDEKKEWIDYMREDIKHLVDCDAIYMLSNWQNSIGAKIELNIAIQLELKIIFE